MLIIQNAYVRNEPIRIKSARLPNMMAQLKWALNPSLTLYFKTA